ncbi:MAG: hypothetical protein IKA64_06750 [Clostridia bacterium]|nr:hypothetical protein [Clostridia bacterium]
MNIGEKIALLRTEHGLSQEGLGERLLVSRPPALAARQIILNYEFRIEVTVAVNMHAAHR